MLMKSDIVICISVRVADVAVSKFGKTGNFKNTPKRLKQSSDFLGNNK